MALTPEQLTDICNKLAEGSSLRAICREMDLAESNVRRWLVSDDEGMAQYASARELQADVLFDEVLEIADDTAKAPEDRRIAIDARKWMAGKLRGKYSDKLVVENNKTVTHRYDLDNLASEKLEQLEAILADAERGSGSAGEPVAPAVH
jgi:hypothetical protein